MLSAEYFQIVREGVLFSLTGWVGGERTAEGVGDCRSLLIVSQLSCGRYRRRRPYNGVVVPL